METTLRAILNKDWITLLLLVCIIGIAAVKLAYNQRFQDFVLLIGIDKYATVRSKEQALWNPFNAILLLIQLCLFSLFIFLGYCILHNQESSEMLGLYLKILIGYTLFEIVKMSFEKIIGYLLNIKDLMNIYLFRKLGFKNFLGLLLIIICSFIVYNDPISHFFIYGCLVLIIILYLISTISILRKYRDQILSLPSYFILYFCTLEIAPYYILYHLYINR